MSLLQAEFPKIEKWGFPILDKDKFFKLDKDIGTVCYGKISGKTKDDYLLCLYHWGDINWALRNGIKPENLVIHFLTYDVGVINPMLNQNHFFKRCKRLRDVGIKYVVEPDFSSWANDPVAIQILNFYNSKCVLRSLQNENFYVIPNIVFTREWSCQLAWYGYPNEMDTCLIDLQHTANVNIIEDYNIKMIEKFINSFSVKNLIMYGATKKVKDYFKDSRFKYVLSRVRLLRKEGRNNG